MMAEIWSRYSKEELWSIFKPKVAHLEWLLTDYSELSVQNKVVPVVYYRSALVSHSLKRKVEITMFVHKDRYI